MPIVLLSEKELETQLFEAEYEDGAIIWYRRLTQGVFQKIRKRHVRYEWQRGQGRVPVYDDDAIFWDIIDFIIAKWNDKFVNLRGEPLPCTLEWKKQLPNHILLDIQEKAGVGGVSVRESEAPEEELQADLKNSNRSPNSGSGDLS
jgi:hypothetical protein